MIDAKLRERAVAMVGVDVEATIFELSDDRDDYKAMVSRGTSSDPYRVDLEVEVVDLSSIADGEHRCNKCKSWKTYVYGVFTRSLDEPETMFIKCWKCDQSRPLGDGAIGKKRKAKSIPS